MSQAIRKADAIWKGNLDKGHGLVSTESRVLTEQSFSFAQRMEGEGKDTNPEELIAAAVASCFSMAMSKTLQDQDTIATELKVSAKVTLEVREAAPRVSHLSLLAAALIPGFTDEKLEEVVATTAENCPVLQLLRPGLEDLDIKSSLQR
ncbi:MAG: OsmC family peroxiredoxin [Oceanipulchritudo sp.]